jgi:hypothetical protein
MRTHVLAEGQAIKSRARILMQSVPCLQLLIRISIVMWNRCVSRLNFTFGIVHGLLAYQASAKAYALPKRTFAWLISFKNP